jgi:hypothetical protein
LYFIAGGVFFGLVELSKLVELAYRFIGAVDCVSDAIGRVEKKL